MPTAYCTRCGGQPPLMRMEIDPKGATHLCYRCLHVLADWIRLTHGTRPFDARTYLNRQTAGVH
jgi:hypothetical protein